MYSHLSSISSVLAGFSLVFVGTLLTVSSSKKILEYTFVLAIITSLLLVLCAVGWTFLNMTQDRSEHEMQTFFTRYHRILSITFLLGIFSLMACLGSAGWARSKSIGLFSTILAIICFSIIIMIIGQFIS